MPDDPHDLSAWQRYHRLVIDALGLSSPAELLSALASGWRELSGAAAVEWRTPHHPDMEAAAPDESLTVPLDDYGAVGYRVVVRWHRDEPLRADWIDRLAALSGRLLSRSSAAEERLRDAKLAALAELAAGAGHEINNPLATIAGRAQMLLRDEADPDRRQALATIGGQALRIRDMIGDLRLFARPPEPMTQAVELASAVHEICGRFRDRADARVVAFEFSPSAEDIQVQVDPVQFAVAIGALVVNALEAVAEGGRVAVTSGAAEDRGRRVGVVTVEDNGPGLSGQDREHLFDPFYSGRPAGRGLGFGLSKCWRIVTNHGGRIDARSGEGVTIFRTVWPASPESRQSGAAGRK